MSNLGELFKQWGLLLTTRLKGMALNNKKKLIFLAVVVLAGYVASKKLTMAHFINFIDFATRAAQYLPLPHSPQIRTTAEYAHPPTLPLRDLIKCMDVDAIRARITRKEASWQDLKTNIVTGAVCTMVLYNAESLIMLAQNKYQQEFLTLQASETFDRAIYCLRKAFLEHLSITYRGLQTVLAPHLARIDIMRSYNFEELAEIMTGMVGTVFQGRFNVNDEQRRSSVERVGKTARNLFMTVETEEEGDASKVAGFLGGVGRLLGGVLRVHEWFPSTEVVISEQRYQLVRSGYLQALKKAEPGLVWPNPTSSQLFTLVHEQLQQLLLSLNFSVLLRSFADYNLQMLLNRLRLLMEAKKRTAFKFSEFLPSLYKILQEEFLRQDQLQHRNRFHDAEVKKAIRKTHGVEGQAGEEGGEEELQDLDEYLLEEVATKHAFEFLQREAELKYFNERSGVILRPRKGGQREQAGQMKKLMGMMNGSEGLGQLLM